MFDTYDKHYKKWVFIPLFIFVVSVSILVSNQLSTGTFIERDVELTGGKMFTFEITSADAIAIEDQLPQSNVHITTGLTNSLLVEVPFEAEESVVFEVVNANADVIGEPDIREVGPVLGKIFFQQAITAIIVAFIFMSVLVFLLFRSTVPSGIVILSVVIDIIATVAIMHLLGISLSLPVLAALLTLIGYSVDTDILLTTKLLKNNENLKEQTRSAMKTGLMMNVTTIAALTSLFFLTGSFVLEQIAFVLIIGIFVDIIVTWMGNLGILKWWLSGKS